MAPTVSARLPRPLVVEYWPFMIVLDVDVITTLNSTICVSFFILTFATIHLMLVPLLPTDLYTEAQY